MLFWKQVPFCGRISSQSVCPAQAMSYPIYNYGRFNTQPRTVSTNIAMFICNKHIKGSNLCNFMFITKSFPELLSTLVSYRKRITTLNLKPLLVFKLKVQLRLALSFKYTIIQFLCWVYTNLMIKLSLIMRF